jgi:hypothetical protein
MPHLPSGTEPLPERWRRASKTKRGYQVWVDPEGHAGSFDGSGDGVWKLVKRKQYDWDNDILLLTFDDDTELKMRGTAGLRTRRLAPSEEQEIDEQV